MPRKGGSFDPHFNLFFVGLPVVKLVTFTFGMEFCVLTAIIFSVTDIYKQEPTLDEFLGTHFKNTVHEGSDTMDFAQHDSESFGVLA